MKFKYVIMTSITAIFLVFVTFLWNNTETNVPDITVKQESPNKTPVKENIPKKEEPIKVTEVKKEDKKDSVDNYTIEQQKKGTYLIRDDNYIPLKLNPLSDPDYLVRDLMGYKVGKYTITIKDDYNEKITLNNLELFLANYVPYKVEVLDGMEFMGMYDVIFIIESDHNSIIELESYLQ